MNFKLYWENILEYFEEEEWPLYDVDDNNKVATAHMRGDNLSFRIFIFLHEAMKTLNLSWYYPNNVPPNKRHVVRGLLNRLNHKVIVGKFVMNPEDGNLAYRISLSVKGTRFSMGQFDSFIGWGIWTADDYYPKFMSLIYGSHTVDEVLEDKAKPQLRLVEKAEEQGELFEEDEART